MFPYGQLLRQTAKREQRVFGPNSRPTTVAGPAGDVQALAKAIPVNQHYLSPTSSPRISMTIRRMSSLPVHMADPSRITPPISGVNASCHRDSVRLHSSDEDVAHLGPRFHSKALCSRFDNLRRGNGKVNQRLVLNNKLRRSGVWCESEDVRTFKCDLHLRCGILSGIMEKV